jgi:predicted transcriptional regulator
MDNDIKKKINKSKLTKEEMRDFLAKLESADVKLEHSRAYRTLMNEVRRNLLRYIGCEVRSIDELKKEFKLEVDQLLYHLSMLKQCLYIIESREGWKSTPKGLGFLENAKMGHY